MYTHIPLLCVSAFSVRVYIFNRITTHSMHPMRIGSCEDTHISGSGLLYAREVLVILYIGEIRRQKRHRSVSCENGLKRVTRLIIPFDDFN